MIGRSRSEFHPTNAEMCARRRIQLNVKVLDIAKVTEMPPNVRSWCEMRYGSDQDSTRCRRWWVRKGRVAVPLERELKLVRTEI